MKQVIYNFNNCCECPFSDISGGGSFGRNKWYCRKLYQGAEWHGLNITDKDPGYLGIDIDEKIIIPNNCPLPDVK
jgi:hypothetical protein